MKKDNALLNGLMGKLKVETIPIVHRSPISKILRGTGEFVVYRLPFDDYGDLMIDQEGLDLLLETQEAIESSYGDLFKEPDGHQMTDEQYEAYKEWLAINAIRQFIGV